MEKSEEKLLGPKTKRISFKKAYEQEFIARAKYEKELYEISGFQISSNDLHTANSKIILMRNMAATALLSEPLCFPRHTPKPWS